MVDIFSHQSDLGKEKTMSRTGIFMRVAAVAVPVFFVLVGCSPLNDLASQQAGGGWYMELRVDAPPAKSIAVTEYTVTGMSILVRDPEGNVLQTIAWAAGDGAQTYDVPVREAGQHRIDVTHVGEQDGQVVQASESAAFDIEAMKITAIDIIPGRVGGIRLPGGQPDLVVSALSVTSWTPNSISYSYTIKNIGTAPANLDGPTSADSDNVSVQAYLSADTVFANGGDIPAGGSIVGSSPLGNLNPGQTLNGSFTSGAAVDPNATPYLVLMVDSGNVVAESNERNNTLATPVVAKPDLIVSALSVTSWTANTISYRYTIKNIGTGPANLDGPTSANADNVSVQAYLSRDTIFANSDDIPAGGTIIGNSPLGVLNPGDTFTGFFSASAKVNNDITPYLVLKVDFGNVVAESDETNNTLAVTF
jgi:hypothetical protein